MAQPKSMYLRQVTVMLGLIILCMTLLGAGFFSLSYRYQLQEIQSTLDRNAGFISDYASVALTEGSSLTDKDFVNYIQSVVLLTDTTVLVCNTEGMVVCAAGTNWNQELLTSGEVSIPAWATNQLLSGRSYSGMTTFDGIFNTRCYVTSEVLSPLVRDQNTGELVSSNVPTGFLFVANDATSVMEFLQHTFQLFFITAIAVLLITLIICSFTVQKMVDPLKSMCSFAHRFARGEVDVRITDYKNRNDEIGELAAAFNAMADSLAQAEQKRSEFVANVSHELRTPITNIRSYAETLAENPDLPPDTTASFLGVILSESDRMTHIVQDLLTLSRFDSGHSELNLTTFPFAGLLEESCQAMRIEAQRRGHTLRLEGTGGLPAIRADRERISQVVMNVLSNAIKYTPDGGRIVLTAGCTPDRVWLEVADNGIGIPLEDRDRIFERFYRVDKARSRESGGTGLGLSIAQEIVRQHQGSLTLVDRPGPGTTLRLELKREGPDR